MFCILSMCVCVCLTTCGWVCEGEAGLGLCQLVEVVQAHDVGRLKMTLRVLVALPAAPHLVVELGGGQGCQEGRVGAGDAHSVV